MSRVSRHWPTPRNAKYSKIELRREHLWSSAKAYGAIWITLVLGGLLAHAAFVLRATAVRSSATKRSREISTPPGQRSRPSLRGVCGLAVGGALALAALVAGIVRRTLRSRR